MCTQQLSKFIAALLAGVSGCSMQKPAPTTPESTTATAEDMNTAGKGANYTLTIWQNRKTISHPSEADLRAAVAALDDSDIGPRLALRTSDQKNQIEVSGAPRDGFAFDYFEANSEFLYASRKTDYSREEVVKLLIAYISGTADWKSMAEWQKFRR